MPEFAVLVITISIHLKALAIASIAATPPVTGNCQYKIASVPTHDEMF
ncbi:hypothetical protein GR197_21255 [Rhizobium phaseoli]|uniref:Uncharacterized protein n=1 Tax=Rhizobium phaseoli TaxID=396 RepID=A0A7K3UJS4_9HYPH|nr:hypothetical protein [Rhizobium phaseoli]NEJ73038.1 hypothetical protein [Rhizobium phaseoli]